MGQRKPTVISKAELKFFLDEQANHFNRPSFIEHDPVSIPHLFSKKEDIEISGFLTATIAWGQRISILKNARHLMQLMDDAPYDFVRNFSNADLKPFKKFVHRTFNATDCTYFMVGLQHIYQSHDGLENAFANGIEKNDSDHSNAIAFCRTNFFQLPHQKRTEKHFSNPHEGSAAKRINMFLRWMVRKDNHGVDFGIWKKLSPALLSCPLDVHSGRVARELGLLKRKQNDWKAVVELTNNLKMMDPVDPVKYDFALFGIGVTSNKYKIKNQKLKTTH